ncbi:hypothetical protein CBI35_17655 [Pantoea sp. AV62]|nr:hypothetical protein CBI35_17655 [Pantoea sp. AV62]
MPLLGAWFASVSGQRFTIHTGNGSFVGRALAGGGGNTVKNKSPCQTGRGKKTGRTFFLLVDGFPGEAPVNRVLTGLLRFFIDSFHAITD